MSNGYTASTVPSMDPDLVDWIVGSYRQAKINYPHAADYLHRELVVIGAQAARAWWDITSADIDQALAQAERMAKLAAIALAGKLEIKLSAQPL
jgi:hypothetical protein